jgi:PAS domain S-box-containing protein
MKDAIHAAEHAAMHKRLPPDLFSGLLAISADAVIAVDDEQRIIFFNEGAERIFGWKADEVGGQYLEILLPERYRAAHRGHVAGFGAAHGRARLMGERQQLSGLRRNGDEFPCEAAIQRIEVHGHNVYAAVLRDISARQRAEDALREAVTDREEMLAIVSHDLRNPANAVRMLARSILDDAREGVPEHVLSRVTVMEQAAQQIDALIQDLLDTTRLAGGKLHVTLRSVDAARVVRTSVQSLQPLADDGRVALELALPDDLPPVHADADRLAQLLSNLLGNAIKFTPPDGTVRIAARLEGPMVRFDIADSGDGIPAEDLPHVFERFYRTDRARGRDTGGTGLGLAIVKGAVEAMGGQITVESRVGSGSRFTITLASGQRAAGSRQ